MRPEARASKGEGSAALAFAFAAAFAGLALLPVTALLDLKRAAGLFAAALLAAGLALRASAGRPWRSPDAGLDRLLLILLAAWLLDALGSELRSGIDLRGPLLSGGLVLAWGLARAPRSLRDKAMSSWRWALVAVSAYAVLQRLGLEPVRAFAMAGSRARAMGSFGNAGYLAAFLCLSWPALLSWRGRRRWAALGLALAAMLASGSRAGLLAVAVQACLLAAWAWPRISAESQRRSAWALGLGLAGIAVLVALWWRPTLRWEAWSLGLHVWAERPLFGWGAGSFAIAAEPLLSPQLLTRLAASRQYVEDPHQVFILVLAEGGLVGLGAFIAAIVLSLRLAWRQSGPEGRAFCLGALGLLAQSSLDRFFFSAGVILPLFALLGLAVPEAGPPAVPKPRWAWIGALASLSLVVWVLRPLHDWQQAVAGRDPRVLDALKLEEETAGLRQRVLAGATADDWERLGAAEAGQQRFDKALAAYSQALQLSPTAGCAQNMGNCLMMLQRPSEAVHFYDRAVKMAPDDADAWFSLGYGLYQSQQLKQAVVALDEALRLQPEHPEARKLKEQILQ